MDCISGNTMHILEVAAQVTTLGESLLAEGAFERAETCVLPEVISKVAALLEYASTLRVLALKVQLYSLCLWVLDSDSLVPLLGYPFKGLMFAPASARVSQSF